MKTTELSEYDTQALDFLAKTGATINVKYNRTGLYFDSDKEERDIYDIELKRGSRTFKFEFGNSINDSGFYYKMGRQIVPIDRKHLEHKNLASLIKSKSWDFNPKYDTIHYPVAPSEYSVLCCLTKYNPETFEDFCSEFGYDTDSRSAKKTFKAVTKEWLKVSALFNDEELELLREIN